MKTVIKVFLISLIIFLYFFRLEIYKYAYNMNLVPEYKSKLLVLNDNNDTSIVVTPVLDKSIDKNKNLIFCTSFQLGWNDLTNNVFKETIEIESPPYYYNKINELVKQPPLISEDAYLTLSGVVGSQTNDTIKAALNKKFQNIFSSDGLLIEYNSVQKGIFIFSTLFKNLTFEKEFTKVENFKFNCFDKKIALVEAFGIENDDKNFNVLDKQIEIFCDNSKKNSLNNNYRFVLKLKTKNENDEAIISNFEPDNTLEKTYLKINKYISDPNNHKKISAGSSVIIPKIDFDIIYNYNEINNKKVLNEKYKDYTIISTKQKIKFKFN